MATAFQSDSYQNDAFQIDVVATVSGGKGDNKGIFKPTGLVDRPKKTIHVPEGRKTVPERVEQTRQLVEEIKAEAEPVSRMSLTKIDEEIGVRLRQKLRTEEDELIILLLAAAGS